MLLSAFYLEFSFRKEMKTALCFSLFLTFFTLTLSEPILTTTSPLPQAAKSFNLSYIQQVGSCSYTVVITTSCSSVSYTRDQISLAFGDAYGNQIYAPRIDDPSTRTFERCSSDTFQIDGPCAYQICYVYLYRVGPDGWKPGSVKIYGYNSRAVTFNYNTFIPSGTWYGFNLCGNSASSAYQLARQIWVLYVIVGSVLIALL